MLRYYFIYVDICIAISLDNAIYFDFFGVLGMAASLSFAMSPVATPRKSC